RGDRRKESFRVLVLLLNARHRLLLEEVPHELRRQSAALGRVPFLVHALVRREHVPARAIELRRPEAMREHARALARKRGERWWYSAVRRSRTQLEHLDGAAKRA